MKLGAARALRTFNSRVAFALCRLVVARAEFAVGLGLWIASTKSVIIEVVDISMQTASHDEVKVTITIPIYYRRFRLGSEIFWNLL